MGHYYLRAARRQVLRASCDDLTASYKITLCCVCRCFSLVRRSFLGEKKISSAREQKGPRRLTASWTRARRRRPKNIYSIIIPPKAMREECMHAFLKAGGAAEPQIEGLFDERSE
jgi:hypothetical protein